MQHNNLADTGTLAVAKALIDQAGRSKCETSLVQGVLEALTLDANGIGVLASPLILLLAVS